MTNIDLSRHGEARRDTAWPGTARRGEGSITRQKWPWPDDRLDRRSRVAHMYRSALEAADPAGCAELDAAMLSFGQAWIVEGVCLDPESLLTTTELAEIADVTPEAVRMWAYRGRIARCATNSRGAAQYRWGDVLDAQRAIQARKHRNAVHTA